MAQSDINLRRREQGLQNGKTPKAVARGLARTERTYSPSGAAQLRRVSANRYLVAAKDVRRKDALLQPVTATEVPHLIGLGKARRAIVDRPFTQCRETGERSSAALRNGSCSVRPRS